MKDARKRAVREAVVGILVLLSYDWEDNVLYICYLRGSISLATIRQWKIFAQETA